MITIIAAIAANGVIGNHNRLPWPHLPGDMKHFQSCITDQRIVMGSKTAQSFRNHPKLQKNQIAQRGGHPSAKHSIIMSQTQKPSINQCIKTKKIVETSNQTIEEIIQSYPHDNLWIIGGAKIYEARLSYANRMIITHIDKDYEGDSFFPNWNQHDWILIQEKAGEDEGTKICFYQKK
ncbi:MAG: dihydrofolate reductase [Candidatus Absconditabacterales bacterium]|nr:dihydrofolate reductase [Candidatus Absconditabacterales bacterium]